MPARLRRLSPVARERVKELLTLLDSGNGDALAEFGALLGGADDYDPLPDEEPAPFRDESLQAAELRRSGEIYNGVWPRAAEMRRNGELLRAASAIRCPVVAIHGEHDPHPWRGVKEPLERVLPEFSFHLLLRCGHTPWLERQARGEFFKLLEQALES